MQPIHSDDPEVGLVWCYRLEGLMTEDKQIILEIHQAVREYRSLSFTRRKKSARSIMQ